MEQVRKPEVGECVTWAGCYDSGWQGLIVDEAFAHPAKFAHGLICRIFDELALPRGSVVVDPFGGVGLGGIVAASRGLQWCGVELESKFCELAEANFAKHAAMWRSAGDPMPRIVQGDSRQLRANLGPVLADCVVASPPFAGSVERRENDPEFIRKMAERDNKGHGWSEESIKKWAAKRASGYGSTPGNIANLKAGSVDAVVRESVDCIVSSPPYEGSLDNILPRAEDAKDNGAVATFNRTGKWPERRPKGLDYGESADNLGNQQGNTFWAAAADIVRECYAILRPGGVAVWVCKDFVRNKARVPFSDDWRRLCVSAGFVLVKWVKASLVKEERHRSLFGGDEVRTKERKSFFRRLAEKNGSPRIDHEDVLIMAKPAGPVGAGSVADCVVSSPPYAELGKGVKSGDVDESKWTTGQVGRKMGRSHHTEGYGSTPGQLGALRPGSVEEAIDPQR